MSGSFAADYGRLVYDSAIRRGLIDICDEVSGRAYSTSDTGVQDQIEAAEQKLYDLATKGEVDGGPAGFEAALKSSLQSIESAWKSDGKISGAASGLSELDRKLGGLHPSDLLIVAGRPGMGKTGLGLNIAYNVAQSVMQRRIPAKLDGPALLFSLEMSADQIASRVLSFTAEIPGHRMCSGSIMGDEFERLATQARELQSLPLLIDDTAAISVPAIRARARRVKRKQGLSLVVIDYIQLISPTAGRKSDNRVQEVTEISRQLKILAKELDVPVIALSQLSRGVEGREDKKPLLSDLRESGSIEQDADIVMFVYRDEYYKEREEPQETGSDKWIAWKAKMDAARGKAEIIIAKHRHGPTDAVSLAFVGEFVKFGNLY